MEGWAAGEKLMVCQWNKLTKSIRMEVCSIIYYFSFLALLSVSTSPSVLAAAPLLLSTSCLHSLHLTPIFGGFLKRGPLQRGVEGSLSLSLIGCSCALMWCDERGEHCTAGWHTLCEWVSFWMCILRHGVCLITHSVSLYINVQTSM